MEQEQMDAALLEAARTGAFEVVQELVASGVSVDAADGNGARPLHLASWNGYLAVVEFLVDKGARIDAADNLGRLPLHDAAQHGHLPVAEFLLGKGAKVDAVDAHGRQALHWAAQDGHKGAVELLLNAGALPSAKDSFGLTPDDLAGKHPEVRAFLKEWFSPESLEKRRQAGIAKDIRDHWKKVGKRIPPVPRI